MRQPRPPGDDRRSRRHRDDPENEHRRDRDRDPDWDDSGDDPLRHARIIERRFLGSVPPTPALYARALQQWLALPGAVVRSASEVRPPEPPAGSSRPAPKQGPQGGEP
jgi:hypothetical protein